MRGLAESVARSFGHDVSAFEDSDGALSAFKSNPFSLVVLDRDLPVMGGLELCRNLRELPGGNMAVVLVMTPAGSLEELETGLVAGVDDYIATPADRATLEMRLKIAERMVLNLWERKHAEEAMRSKEERFRSVVETASDAIICIDRHGDIFYWNHAAYNIFGYSAGEIIGKPMTILIPNYYRDLHLKGLNQAVVEERTELMGGAGELRALRKDGSEFPIELSRAAWRTSKGLFFTGIIRDITERVKARQLKDEFVSTVSHELKTPLTSIRGSLSLIMKGLAGELPEEARNLIGIAYSNCERLIPLVNDIMDIERLESGKVQYEMRPLPLARLLTQAVEANSVFAEQLGVKLRIGQVVPDAMVMGDGVRLMQVMANLLSNAAKFSPPGHEVTVSMSREGAMLRISVTDRGAGVPETFRNRIFQKFAQADSKDTRLKGGAGLGLSITKAIIENHGGRIDYVMDGAGTTFYFELPESAGEAAGAETVITTFYEGFEQEWRKAAKNAEPLSLIMVRVDSAKGTHEISRKMIASALGKAVMRAGDMILPFDEMEFAVLLPATDMKGALSVAERARVLFEGLDAKSPEGAAGLTFSVGVASAMPGGGSSPDMLLDAARQALFQAIQEGGNRVRHFSEPA